MHKLSLFLTLTILTFMLTGCGSDNSTREKHTLSIMRADGSVTVLDDDYTAEENQRDTATRLADQRSGTARQKYVSAQSGCPAYAVWLYDRRDGWTVASSKVCFDWQVNALGSSNPDWVHLPAAFDGKIKSAWAGEDAGALVNAPRAQTCVGSGSYAHWTNWQDPLNVCLLTGVCEIFAVPLIHYLEMGRGPSCS